jgi:hypothetical protein
MSFEVPAAEFLNRQGAEERQETKSGGVYPPFLAFLWRFFLAFLGG